MNLDSPAAALMASMGSTGLTPLPSTQDGLGISTGIPGALSTQDGHTSKNPQKERHDRLKEIAQILKNAPGRGVSRTNVQTLATIHGFEPFYDEDDPDTLTLAGQQYALVDVVFAKNKSDVVEKSRLKLNDLATAEEEVLQKDASQVLTRNLTEDTNQRLPWHDLTDFSANLEYLSQLDRISTSSSTSCFKIMDNLYDTFQRIWIEEKKRMKWRHDLHHLCQSNVGEPAQDAGQRLGVSVRYWTGGRNFYTKEGPKTPLKDAESDDWTSRFSVEAGLPSMVTSQKWLAEEPLTSTARAEDIFQESAVDKPSWQDPATTQMKSENNGESMDVDPSAASTGTSGVHFICNLEPEILLPWHLAESMNKTFQMLEMRQEQLTTYQQSLQRDGTASLTTLERWNRSQDIFSKDGKHERRTHSYTLYTGPRLYAYAVRKLSFTHPRQFVDVLPVLRQYALVNTLLQSIAPPPGAEPEPASPAPTRKDGKERIIRDGKEIWVRSNKPKLESKLDAIMGSSKPAKHNGSTILPIDVRLDPAQIAPGTKTCRFDITFPLSTSVLSATALARLKAKSFLRIEIEILLNGVVEIADIAGIELGREKMEELKKRLARVVRCIEDVGYVVAWITRELEDS